MVFRVEALPPSSSPPVSVHCGKGSSGVGLGPGAMVESAHSTQAGQPEEDERVTDDVTELDGFPDVMVALAGCALSVGFFVGLEGSFSSDISLAAAAAASAAATSGATAAAMSTKASAFANSVAASVS